MRSQQKYKAIRAVLNQLKAAPCIDCGGVFPPCCMDYDHRDPKTKKFQVGSGIMYGLDSLLEEIAKCDLVCANCHRIRTHLKKTD